MQNFIKIYADNLFPLLSVNHCPYIQISHSDSISIKLHSVRGRQRNSRFAVSWPSTQYPAGSIAQVRYVAHAHSTCDEQGRGQ